MENKRIRQYIGLVAAVLSYYLIHEGAHLITALFMGVFKEVKFLGFGMQIDVAVAQMTDLQMGIFCLAGAVCTWIAAVLLTLLEHAGTVLCGNVPVCSIQRKKSSLQS